MTDEPRDRPGPARPVRSPRAGDGARRSRAVQGSFARSMLEAAARGTGLIAVAVAIGIVLLQLSDDTTQPLAAGGEAVEVDTSAPKAVSTTTASAPTTTTVTTAAEPPAKDVTVLVLNGSGRNLQATPMSERLSALGYRTLEPGNASLREDSIVLCRPDHAGDADALVAATGLTASTGTLDDADFPDAGEADCVVIIGSR